MENRPPTETIVRQLLSELERREMETARLTREIRSSATSPGRRALAIERRDQVQEQWVSIILQLDSLGQEAR